MIIVEVKRDSEGFIWEFTVNGHAGSGEYGKDIVCAAASAIGYNALNALDKLVGIRNYKEEDGHLTCTIPKNVEDIKKHDIQVILETIIIGFKQIEFSYKDYIMKPKKMLCLQVYENHEYKDRSTSRICHKIYVLFS
jgi:uncharacterized protein YsxB (DUF464 family)